MVPLHEGSSGQGAERSSFPSAQKKVFWQPLCKLVCMRIGVHILTPYTSFSFTRVLPSTPITNISIFYPYLPTTHPSLPCRTPAPVLLLLICLRIFLSQIQLPYAHQTWINPIPTSICCKVSPKPICGLPGPAWIPTGLLQHVLGGDSPPRITLNQQQSVSLVFPCKFRERGKLFEFSNVPMIV